MNWPVKTSRYVVEFARDNRHNLTECESLLWERLRRRQIDGFRFRCQHPVYLFILDFYCHERLLAVEVDGGAHENREEYDHFRDEFLLSLGIRTLRFGNDEVMEDLDGVVWEAPPNPLLIFTHKYLLDTEEDNIPKQIIERPSAAAYSLQSSAVSF